MALLDTLKQQIASTEDIAKLKLAASLLSKRIAELESASAEETPTEETPAEEVSEEPVAEETVEEPSQEEVPAEEEVPPEEEAPVEEPVEEPVPAPKKPSPKPAAKPAPAPAKKAPPAPKFRVGMNVYGPPTGPVKNKTKSYNKGDLVSFDARIEKIEGDKAIIVYTDKERTAALGGTPPLRVRVALSSLEPAQ